MEDEANINGNIIMNKEKKTTQSGIGGIEDDNNMKSSITGVIRDPKDMNQSDDLCSDQSSDIFALKDHDYTLPSKGSTSANTSTADQKNRNETENTSVDDKTQIDQNVLNILNTIAITELFDLFCKCNSLKDLLELHKAINCKLGLKPNRISYYYPMLKERLKGSWRAQELFKKFDVRVNDDSYYSNQACSHNRVLIIGGGPCGLRTAIESQILGAKVVVLEKRHSFSRNNVLHLWPFVIEDLKALGAKEFYRKFCAGSIDHISIRQLQLVLLKVALILGVDFQVGVGFEKLVYPEVYMESEVIGWRAAVTPSNHPVTKYEFDILIGADGKRNTLDGFTPKELLRGRLALAITANFRNNQTEAEAAINEISGITYIYHQQFFNSLCDITGIDLENIAYYKDATHYFVMTAKKNSLLAKQVLIKDYPEVAQLLHRSNINKSALQRYAREAAQYSTNYMFREFAQNHHGEPDIALFDFSSMSASLNASHVKQRLGKKLLCQLVGDSLLEPFWPTGSGCAKGFLSSLDAAWLMRMWGMEPNMNPLAIIARRESVYRLLAHTTNNTLRDPSLFALNPILRYKTLDLGSVLPSRVRRLFDTDDPDAVLDKITLERTESFATKEAMQVWFGIPETDDLLTAFQPQVLGPLIRQYRPDVLKGDSTLYRVYQLLEQQYGLPSVVLGQEMTTDSAFSYLKKVYKYFKGDYPYITYNPRNTERIKKAILKNRRQTVTFVPDVQPSGFTVKAAEDKDRRRSRKRRTPPGEYLSSHGLKKTPRAGVNVAERARDLSQGCSASSRPPPADKPKDLLRSIGKIEKDDWQIKSIEKKIHENKLGRAEPKQAERVPKWDRDQFLARQKLVREGSQSTLDAFEENISQLNIKLRDSGRPDQGTNKVAMIAEQFKFIEPKNDVANSNSKWKYKSKSQKCAVCKSVVFAAESVVADGIHFHRGCFRCSICSTALRPGSYLKDKDKFTCLRHGKSKVSSKPTATVTSGAYLKNEAAKAQVGVVANGSNIGINEGASTSAAPVACTVTGPTDNATVNDDDILSDIDILDNETKEDLDIDYMDKLLEADFADDDDDDDDDDDVVDVVGVEDDDSMQAQDAFTLVRDAKDLQLMCGRVGKWIGTREVPMTDVQIPDVDIDYSSESMAYDDGSEDCDDESDGEPSPEMLAALEVRRREVPMEIRKNSPKNSQIESDNDSVSTDFTDSIDSSSGTAVSTDSDFKKEDRVLPHRPPAITVTAPTHATSIVLTREYPLSRTRSTGGIATKRALELKRRYLLGEQSAPAVRKSDSTSQLDTKLEAVRMTITECQKLLHPAPLPQLTRDVIATQINKCTVEMPDIIKNLCNAPLLCHTKDSPNKYRKQPSPDTLKKQDVDTDSLIDDTSLAEPSIKTVPRVEVHNEGGELIQLNSLMILSTENSCVIDGNEVQDSTNIPKTTTKESISSDSCKDATILALTETELSDWANDSINLEDCGLDDEQTINSLSKSSRALSGPKVIHQAKNIHNITSHICGRKSPTDPVGYFNALEHFKYADDGEQDPSLNTAVIPKNLGYMEFIDNDYNDTMNDKVIHFNDKPVTYFDASKHYKFTNEIKQDPPVSSQNDGYMAIIDGDYKDNSPTNDRSMNFIERQFSETRVKPTELEMWEKSSPEENTNVNYSYSNDKLKLENIYKEKYIISSESDSSLTMSPDKSRFIASEQHNQTNPVITNSNVDKSNTKLNSNVINSTSVCDALRFTSSNNNSNEFNLLSSPTRYQVLPSPSIYRSSSEIISRPRISNIQDFQKSSIVPNNRVSNTPTRDKVQEIKREQAEQTEVIKSLVLDRLGSGSRPPRKSCRRNRTGLPMSTLLSMDAPPLPPPPPPVETPPPRPAPPLSATPSFSDPALTSARRRRGLLSNLSSFLHWKRSKQNRRTTPLNLLELLGINMPPVPPLPEEYMGYDEDEVEDEVEDEDEDDGQDDAEDGVEYEVEDDDEETVRNTANATERTSEQSWGPAYSVDNRAVYDTHQQAREDATSRRLARIERKLSRPLCGETD